MSISWKRSVIASAVAALVAVAFVAPQASSAAEGATTRTYVVTVENLTESQALTPAVVASHAGSTRLFRVGAPASDGLQHLAENGGVPVLASELEATEGFDDVRVAGSAPIGPGESASVMLSAGPGAWRLSAAAMLICTNDGFAGAGHIWLPHSYGEVSVRYGIAYDAGTETNTEDYADLVPPCDGLGQSGESDPTLAEDGVVRRHRGIVGDADLNPADHGWTGPVFKVSVERVDVYEVTVENLTGTQAFTPFVFATHGFGSPVFTPGDPASHGLQQLAENGGVPVLASELEEGPAGTVAVIGSAPIAPGASEGLEIVAYGGFNRASLAGMLICTNDGFAGVGNLVLPDPGGTTTVTGMAYDAGTETNTEDYADLVPPCDGLGQSGESDPALAEGGTVMPHAGIAGTGDLDPATHGWTEPVVRVVIANLG
jgi:hypothetical protein